MYYPAGVKMGLGLTGKPGRACVGACYIGAFLGAWILGLMRGWGWEWEDPRPGYLMM